MKLSRTKIILAGLVFHLLAAVFSVGYHHCDELVQVFEFAGCKLGLNSAASLPWEFHEQMRSGIQPFLVFAITRLANSVGIVNPFTIAMLIRVLQALFSFMAAMLLANVLERQLAPGRNRLLFLAFTLLFWCMPYFHARFSSENFAASLFVTGLALALKRPGPAVYLVAGFLFGLAFHTRFHLLFMIAGYAGWELLINRPGWKALFSGFAGMLAAIGAGYLADYWLYDQPVWSWWNYLDLNLFKGRASDFGEQPFYYYFTESILQLVPPFSLVIIFAIAGFWVKFRKHPLIWVTLPFIILHFFVGHKELRFLFPVLYLMPFMVARYFESTEHQQGRLQGFIRGRGFRRFFYVVNAILLLVFSIKPADDISFSLKKIYDITDTQPAILFYETNDPYNDAAALHYFRKESISTMDINTDSLPALRQNTFLFVENYNSPELVVKHGRTFRKIYSSYPDWFGILDFNGWQQRSFSFAIYRELSIR